MVMPAPVSLKIYDYEEDGDEITRMSDLIRPGDNVDSDPNLDPSTWESLEYSGDMDDLPDGYDESHDGDIPEDAWLIQDDSGNAVTWAAFVDENDARNYIVYWKAVWDHEHLPPGPPPSPPGPGPAPPPPPPSPPGPVPAPPPPPPGTPKSQDMGVFLSGGASNTNPFLSTGGAISSKRITFSQGSITFNNLWNDVTERQTRYGLKDIRVIYLKNMNPTMTFKNARAYWNKIDKYTSLQIGRSLVNGVENTTTSIAAVGTSNLALPIPPEMWFSVGAADVFRIIQDFNDINATKATRFGEGSPIRILGLLVQDASATIYNQKVSRFTALLRRNGEARGPVECRITDASSTLVAELGSVDSASISNVPGQPQQVSFENLSNEHIMQIGDAIALRYLKSGVDEEEGSPDDYILWGTWEWTGQEGAPPENITKDIPGVVAAGQVNGQRVTLEGGQMDLVWKAESWGPEGGGPEDPCNPNAPGPPGPPGPPTPPPPPPSGFIILADFSDLGATTAYAVGNGGEQNTFRQAVKIDGSTAAILAAPIARFTLLARRVGNPQGIVTCRIWDRLGVVKQTLGEVNITNITASPPQWTQIPFTLQENGYNMVIGDLIGVEFTTGTPADHIVLAGWQWQNATDAANAALDGVGNAVADRHGVRIVYPNSGAFHYENEWEIPSDSSSMRWDFTDPPTNAEMTCYFLKSSPSSDTVSCKIRGGKHDGGGSTDGCCYIPQFPCTGGTMEFEIECPHPSNHSCPTSGIDGTALSLAQWHGYKVAWWNIGNPPTTVHMEAWQDKGNNSGTTPINQWELLQVHEDSDGNCGNIDNPLFRPKGGTSQCTFRIDNNSGTDYKWLSIVEIQPTGAQQPGPGPGPVPSPPPPGPGPSPSPPPAPTPVPPPPQAKDYTGTSIHRWNGTVWTVNDGGMSDLVYRAEKFLVGAEAPEPSPAPVDPGTKRKPTSYDQGIIIPPLNPGDHKALIMERLVPPDVDEITVAEEEAQLVIEIDTTTEPSQPTDPGQPPPPSPPPPGPPGPPPPPGPPGPPPPPSPGPPPAPGQLGPYASTGRQLSTTTRGPTTRHYASGKPDDKTIEKNADNITFQNYQCIYFVTLSSIEHDDNISTKLGGTHSGGWDDHGVSFNSGKTCLGNEPNHPDTNSCIKTGPSIGNILNKRVGVCAVWRRQGPHTELWTKLPTQTAWVKALENTGALGGFTPNQSGDHESQLRIDGFEATPNIDTAIVQEIAAGSTSTSNMYTPQCPEGQHWDHLQEVCVLDAGSPGTTDDGIVLPSLPYDSYTLDFADCYMMMDHKANGSFREYFDRVVHDMNSVMVGGYLKVDGPDDEEISAKLGGGVHSSSDGGIAGRCYEINITLDGYHVVVYKENPHGVYNETSIRNDINIGPRQGHYTGVIFMKANIWWQGDPAVRLKAWVDITGMDDAGVYTPANQHWIQVLDAVDAGGWYDKAWLTTAVPGNSRAILRVDQQDEASYDAKFLFCARIIGGPASY